MWAHVCSLTFNFLCNISLSTANIEIEKISKAEYGGFRCGLTVFTHDMINTAARDAYEHAVSSSRAGKFTYPEVYHKTFGFEGEHYSKYLWQIRDPISPPGIQGKDYFIVMIGMWKPIGVVERRSTNEYIKCVIEPDLSMMANHRLVSGFQCPHGFYASEQIMAEVSTFPGRKEQILSNSFDISGKSPVFLNSMSVFGISEPIFSCPIKHHKVGAYHGMTSIVVDKQMNFMGMVHEEHATYHTCRISPHDHFVPRFIHTNILQDPLKLESGQMDVFQCEQDLLRSDLILQGVYEAVSEFKINIRSSKVQPYPALYQKSFVGDQSSSLYLWPTNSDGSIVYQPNSRNFITKKFVFFLVLDDYFNVAGVVKKIKRNSFKECTRKSVPAKFHNHSSAGLS